MLVGRQGITTVPGFALTPAQRFVTQPSHNGTAHLEADGDMTNSSKFEHRKGDATIMKRRNIYALLVGLSAGS
jgi:hypothetical protein